eukprot:TRINITY_DN2541_c0_g1_i1.p1 TRINITY_DN2541_c0_g1~~TRINITY_DN2541_c0_g1_i1.p1  ORF type:complete len:366 (+),score=70.20 TRINITY_DN2541_c0_g1_i1:49-1098(+)
MRGVGIRSSSQMVVSKVVSGNSLALVMIVATLSVCLMSSASCDAQLTNSTTVFPEENYQMWTDVLQAHLDFSNPNLTTVNYTTLATDPNFFNWIDLLATVDTNAMSCDETLAFFINVYNAFAMKMIVSNPCNHDIFGNCSRTIESIRDIGPVFHSVWHLDAGVVNNVTYTLDEIEDLLRSGNTTSGVSCGENPRLHSAIVCASASCPNLGSTAYYPWNISAMLNESMTNFLNAPKGMVVDEVNTQVYLSSIFSWFQGDFVDSSNQLLLYVAEYDTPYQAWLMNNPNASVIFMAYNWTINGDLSCTYCASRPCYPFWALIMTIAGVLVAAFIGFAVFRARKRRAGYEGIQ